ncbi:MAG: enoyl-CoA hydratase/isomerase family protein, partial [Sphingobium sp.]
MSDFQSQGGLIVERDGAVQVITLDRPAAGNTVDLPLSRALMLAAIACDRDDDVRAVLLRSNGRFFCAGGDIGQFGQAGDALPGQLLELTALLHSATARFARMNKPLVTAVQGFAAGAGLGLAIMGDIVIAGEAAAFTPAYAGIGLSPDAGATWLLPRLVGLRRAQQMMLLNTKLDAQAALAAGLVTEVVPDDRLQDHALAIAQRLAAGPTAAFARTRA